MRRTCWTGLALTALVLTGCAGSPTTAPTPSMPTATRSEALQRAVDQLPDSITSRGSFIFATDPAVAPSSYLDGSRVVGWEPELARLVAERMGLRADFSRVAFSTILASVQAGTADAGISSIFDTPERRKQVAFVDYYRGGTAWAALKGSTLTPDTACGKCVAVLDGTYQQTVDLPARSAACTQAGQKPISVLAEPTTQAAVNAVLLGDADAVIGDSPAIAYAIQTNHGQLQAAGRTYEVQPYGIAVAAGNVGVTEALRVALSELVADGTYARLLGKWGVDEGAVPAITVSVR